MFFNNNAVKKKDVCELFERINKEEKLKNMKTIRQKDKSYAQQRYFHSLSLRKLEGKYNVVKGGERVKSPSICYKSY